MQIDYSTSHGDQGRNVPDLTQSFSILRLTLEKAGLIQINVQENYVVLAALKALNDSGYVIEGGSTINLSRPIKREPRTILSTTHAVVIRELLTSMSTESRNEQVLTDIEIALHKPGFDGYLIDNLISLVMALNMRAVDGHTFKMVTGELSHMTTAVTSLIGTGGDWGLPTNSTLTTLVIHVLDHYHNAWYRCLWRWWVGLFTPSRQSQKLYPGPGKNDENTMKDGIMSDRGGNK